MTEPPNTESPPAEKSLSKNALKRQLKRERWEESRQERRAAKRAKIKQKREELKHSGETLPKKRKTSVKNQEESEIRVVLDCSFDELMNEKEITSMSSQLTRCYSENRKALRPVKLYITSLTGRLGDRMETALQGVHHRWRGVQISTEHYEKALDNVTRNDFVYLTADSDNTIQSLEKDKVYIIGGLVDKNRHKRLCYDKAVQQGIQHAKLPIGDFIKMSSRHVLTVNQVLEIMLRWLDFRDWQKAFMEIIPKRKLPQLQKQEGNEEEDSENDETIVSNLADDATGNQG